MSKNKKVNKETEMEVEVKVTFKVPYYISNEERLRLTAQGLFAGAVQWQQVDFTLDQLMELKDLGALDFRLHNEILFLDNSIRNNSYKIIQDEPPTPERVIEQFRQIKRDSKERKLKQIRSQINQLCIAETSNTLSELEEAYHKYTAMFDEKVRELGEV